VAKAFGVPGSKGARILHYKFRRVCEVDGHRDLKDLGELDCVAVEYCNSCGGLRLRRTNWTAPFPTRIEMVAQVLREIAPKIKAGEKLPWLALKQDIRRECAKRYGMSPATVDHSLQWLETAGWKFGLSIDGILQRVPVGMLGDNGTYQAYMRLTDVDGDPPVSLPTFRCGTCGRVLCLEDLVLGETFGCSCDSFYVNDYQIEPTLMVRFAQVRARYYRPEAVEKKLKASGIEASEETVWAGLAGKGSQPWHNSAFDEAGRLKQPYLERLTWVLDKADEQGMVVILGLFYQGQDERLQGEEAVRRARAQP
jgi:hypothetical protein